MSVSGLPVKGVSRSVQHSLETSRKERASSAISKSGHALGLMNAASAADKMCTPLRAHRFPSSLARPATAKRTGSRGELSMPSESSAPMVERSEVTIQGPCLRLPADARQRASAKGMATVQRKKEERRVERLAQIDAQIADGTLTIRQMTMAEHESVARGPIPRSRASTAGGSNTRALPCGY